MPSGMDYNFPVQRGVVSATTTAVYFASVTDVPAPCRVTATLGSAAPAGLWLDAGAGQTRINGPLSAGDVVVIDSAAHTVTLNGVDALSRYNRAYPAWPMVRPGASQLTLAPASSVEVSWRPRLMGLI